jgi:hypothetical protein
MWQAHNVHSANFDVTSLRVTATAAAQETGTQALYNEATPQTSNCLA